MTDRTKTVIWMCALIFLTCFRARWAFVVPRWDESCYMEWLFWFLEEPYPRCYSTAYFPGVAIFWLPAGWLGQWLTILTGIPLASVVPPLVGLSSFLFWSVSLWLLSKSIDRKSFSSPIWALLLLLNIPVLGHATVEAMMAHSVELMVACFTLHQIQKRRFGLAIFSASVLTSIRLNDAPMVCMILGAILDEAGSSKAGRERLQRFLPAIVALSVVGVVLVIWVGIIRGYNQIYIGRDVFANLSPKNFLWAIFNLDAGMIWGAPLWLLSFLWATLNLGKLSWASRGGWLWCLLLLLVYVGTGVHLNGTLNRFLIGSFTAIFFIASELLDLNPKRERLAKILVVVFAAWLTYFFWVSAVPHLIESTVAANLQRVPLAFSHLLHPWGIVKLFGLSPLGYTAFSLAGNTPLFSHYSAYAKYQMAGYPLAILILATAVALVILIRLIRERPEKPGSRRLRG